MVPSFVFLRMDNKIARGKQKDFNYPPPPFSQVRNMNVNFYKFILP